MKRRWVSGSRESAARRSFTPRSRRRFSTGYSRPGCCGRTARPEPGGRFNWRESVWHLRAPVLRALFQQISDPGRLRPLGLVETLDWTADALDRVDKRAFFDRFGQGEAVQYFYEPFLQEFDPDLRKRLGVWYTPDEVVRYMVARVDRALKEDLGIADGLAAENVYVLDPCCGTGAYLAETLRRIAANLEDKGLGALAGARVRQAATERVFGFEIMPAPLVVAHLRVGLAFAGAGRSAIRRRQRAPGRLPHQRAHGLGTPNPEAAAVPRTGRRARTFRARETGRAHTGHNRQPAIQRLRGRRR